MKGDCQEVQFHRVFPKYNVSRLAKIIKAETSGNTVSREVTCGVPQVLVLGPSLWNIRFDGILSLKLPPGMQLISYSYSCMSMYATVSYTHLTLPTIYSV